MNVIIGCIVAGVLFVGSILLWIFADPFKVAEKMDKRKEDKKDL